MMTTFNGLSQRIHVNNKIIWLGVVFLAALIAGIAICDQNWLYLGVMLCPFVIYICIEKPFIFPFGFYVFLLPSDNVLSMMGSSQGATLTKFLGLLTILVLSVKGLFENKLKKTDTILIWWTLFIAYGALSILWALEGPVAVSRIPTALGLLLLYLVVGSYRLQKSEFETIKWFILAGALIASLYTIYSFSHGQSFSSERASMTMGERSTDPNRFVFTLLIPISICIGAFLKQESKIKRIAIGIVLSVLLFSVIISGSRGGMLGIAVIFIIYIISIKQRIAFGTILILSGIILASFIPEYFIERWGSTLETGGAGRFDIWYVGLKALGKYWLTGAGINNFNYAFTEFAHYAPHYRGIQKAPHNIYLGFFVELGVLGIMLMLFAIKNHYRVIQTHFAKGNLDVIMLKASFWGILVSSFPLDTVWHKSFWLIWMLIVMYKNISFKDSESHTGYTLH